MTENHPQFATTRWTLVWQAAQEDVHAGRPALAELVRNYWGPLYAFARRRGLSREDAEDATQEFLAGVMRGELLANADPAKGRFRSYLLAAWRRFLVDQYRRKATVRRGGGQRRRSIDTLEHEPRWLHLVSEDVAPERLFHRGWAESLLDEARRRVRENYDRSDRRRVCECLLPRMTSPVSAEATTQLADELSMTPAAIKIAIHRLRQRFAAAVREVVAETLDDPSQVDAEISELLSYLAHS